jgi:hypothetical protein
VDEVLSGAGAEDVGRYLEHVDRLARRADAAQVAEELHRLTAAWRALLDIHRPTGRRGRCACCRGTTTCTVWRVANAFFVRAPE